MRNARSHTAIGAIGRLSDTIGAIGAFQIVHEHVTAAFHYRSYRRGHYRTIGAIGLLSDYYRSLLSELSDQGSEHGWAWAGMCEVVQRRHVRKSAEPV